MNACRASAMPQLRNVTERGKGKSAVAEFRAMMLAVVTTSPDFRTHLGDEVEGGLAAFGALDAGHAQHIHWQRHIPP